MLSEDKVTALRAPFKPEDISWKPQTVDYKAKTALAVAYADPRAYADRLNEVFGVGGWTDHYEFIVTPFNKLIRGKKAYKDSPATEDKQIPGNKVLCIASIVIHPEETDDYGVEVSSTGDSDAADDNAATSAEAQAFKRAAMKLGLGRYLYELPKVTARYEYGKWLDGPPSLPDWALPPTVCEECTKPIASVEHEGKTYSVAQLTKNSQAKYQKNLCGICQRTHSDAVKSQLVRA